MLISIQVILVRHEVARSYLSNNIINNKNKSIIIKESKQPAAGHTHTYIV